MTLDPYLSNLINQAPDEIRPHLTGFALAVSIPTHSPASVFRLMGGSGEDMYLKALAARDAGSNSLRDEAARLEWLGGRLPVPEVVAGASRDGYEFLLTNAVPGVPAHDRSTGRTRRGVASLMGRALKKFHSTPKAGCSFRHPVVGPTSDKDEVLVHGDYCLPNVLFDAGGWHYLDVGEAGVGDRYIDLVAGIWSLRYNYGKGSAENLLDAYGMRRLDRRKLAAYWKWWNSP